MALKYNSYAHVQQKMHNIGSIQFLKQWYFVISNYYLYSYNANALLHKYAESLLLLLLLHIKMLIYVRCLLLSFLLFCYTVLHLLNHLHF